MIRSFLQKRKEDKAIREWQQSALGQMLANHTENYFVDNPRLSSFSEEFKNNIIADFYQKIFNLSKSENPFLAMRELLASYVIEYASFQVICLTEEEKSEAFYSDCPYISGELYRKIDKLTESNDVLDELKWKNQNITNEELVSFCNSKCVLALYYLNGINYVRGEFDDIDKAKDWFRPFIKSMLIWEEQQAREKIGLQSLLPNDLDTIKHSTFLNIVTNGINNPFYEWEKNWLEE